MIKKAIYKNPVEYIQFDGTNHEEIKEFTGSPYVDLFRRLEEDNPSIIQFEVSGQRKQICKGSYIVRDYWVNIGTFEEKAFQDIYKIVD